ncbi:MAG: hypothetical protein LKM38_04865 [Pseudomonas veronii]|jgi:2-keto-4-pentenoate hydratase|nr:hypothetical protein [Pseudomonas veronii]
MSTPDDVLGQLRQARAQRSCHSGLWHRRRWTGQQGYALLRQTLERRVAAGEKPSGWKVAFRRPRRASTLCSRRTGVRRPHGGDAG